MQAPPFQDKTKRTRRKRASHAAVADPDLNCFARVARMKVRRRVLVVIHGDDDSEEAADLRHSGILRSDCDLSLRY